MKLKKKQLLKKILLIIACSVFAIIACIGIAYGALRIIGRYKLMNGVTSEKPNFNKEDDSQHIVLDENYEIETVFEQNGDEKPTDKNVEGNSEENELIIHSEDDSYDISYQGVKYKYNQNIINILLLGIDKEGEIEEAADGLSGGQSDMLAIFSIDPDKKSMKMIAIPRDTIAKLDIYDENGNYQKSGYAQICLQHGMGDGLEISNERTKKAVSNLLYDLPIHSCSSMNYTGIIPINNAIGGVTLTSLHTFNVFVEGETYTLMGEYAHNYVRIRECDRHFTAEERLQRQKQYISAFIPQCMERLKTNPEFIVELYKLSREYIVTDLEISEMVELASLAAGCSFDGIYTLQGTIDTSKKYERYYLDEDVLKKYIVDNFYVKVEK